ncbi:isochorismatase [Orenia metallireducens]|uniref:Isochorismatase n=1 Tax=Orenia metallireducens TaxID=1413210 RepID=A0A1C0A8F9_9FIRM|nr:cysteine hydrolase family protein [Orenia metallireducens]OCL26518.1 isochorismatase [Orenia metallireducens]
MNLGKNPVLLIIDVQKAFEDLKWGTRNNLDAEEKISSLLDMWRERDYPVIHVQHLSQSETSPLRPGQPGCEFKDEVKPLAGEKVIQKRVNSAFIGTELESYLRENQFDKLVICGLTTNHCVSTTTRMAGNLGFNTFLVADGTATFNRKNYDGQEFSADEVHEISLANLHKEFATVVTMADIVQKINNK